MDFFPRRRGEQEASRPVLSSTPAEMVASHDVSWPFPLRPTGAIRFRSVLLALAHSRFLLGKGESMPLRTLSTRVWSNSKILDRYKRDIERIAQTTLSRLGLTSLPETLWGYGDVSYSVELQGQDVWRKGPYRTACGGVPCSGELRGRAAVTFPPRPPFQAEVSEVAREARSSIDTEDRFASPASLPQKCQSPLEGSGASGNTEQNGEVVGQTRYIDDSLATDQSRVFQGSLLLGLPTVLAEETVLRGDFSPGSTLKGILLIENQTVFLEVLARTYFLRPEILVIWSSGYPSQLHFRLLRQILRQKKVPVYAWCDLDGDGLEIADQICRFAERQGALAQPLLMGPEEWRLGLRGRPATDRDRALAENPKIMARFSAVASLIRQEGFTVEQEALLEEYGRVARALP